VYSRQTHGFFLDSANTARQQMTAIYEYMQKPAVCAFKHIDIFMRYWPKQVVEVFFRFRGGNFFVD
tara:strand:- start:462 stop:659 length:198 start_codon:yes stop_codon:yes gene_type:complete